MTAGIVIFRGENVNRENAEKLLKLCFGRLWPEDIPCKVIDAEEASADAQDFRAVCPVGFKLPGGYAGCVTYSSRDNSADIVALNVQEHTGYISFELMSAEHMGRVFIDNSKRMEVESVLLAAAVMYAMGESLKNIISAINSILKN